VRDLFSPPLVGFDTGVIDRTWDVTFPDPSAAVQGLPHDLYARRRLAANVAELQREAMAVAGLVGNVG
jgi:hypothetical protein